MRFNRPHSTLLMLVIAVTDCALLIASVARSSGGLPDKDFAFVRNG